MLRFREAVSESANGIRATVARIVPEVAHADAVFGDEHKPFREPPFSSDAWRHPIVSNPNTTP